MLPTLTPGSINKILSGENIYGAVLQLLGYKKIPVSAGSDRYRLLISDGVTACSLATLDSQLNHLVTNKKLEKFTIFSVDKYVCNQVQPNHTVIILLNLTVLTPGTDVGAKLGTPVNSSPANVTNRTDSNLAEKRTASEVIDSEQPVYPTSLPSLTSGSIFQILNSEIVHGAVLQLLGYKKISVSAGNDRYRLRISDGLTVYSFAILNTKLNHLVAYKKLEKFTIFSVDECVCHQVQPDLKAIILLNLTILTSGANVGEKLGNPVNLSPIPVTNRSNNSNLAIKRTASEMIGSEQFVHPDSLPTLTSGSIIKILNGEISCGSVLQLLGCKKIPVSVGNDRYRLLISDGVTGCPFTMLNTELNHLVTYKKLEKFTIFSVDEYVCNEVQPGRKVIILLNLTVLTPGSDVGKKLGNPVNLSPVPVTNRINCSNLAKKRTASEMIGSEQFVHPDSLPTLTFGFIKQVLNWKDISSAVIQILDFRLISHSTVDLYQLLISDGVTSSPFGLLLTQLNGLIIRKQLEKFSIIQVDKFICKELKPDCTVIVFCNITVLIPGEVVGNMLGNPERLTSIPDLEHSVDEIVSNFASLNI